MNLKKKKKNFCEDGIFRVHQYGFCLERDGLCFIMVCDFFLFKILQMGLERDGSILKWVCDDVFAD